MKLSRKIKRHGDPLVALLLVGALFMSGPASSQSTLMTQQLGRGAEQALMVPLYKSRVVALDAPATRISVGNPEIADILILRSTQLYVLGKDLGTTNVLLWDRNDRLIGTVSVEVTHDLQALKAKLHSLMPNEEISVYSAQRNIILAGRVSNVSNMNAAIRIAEGYFKESQGQGGGAAGAGATQFAASNTSDDTVGQVINMLSVGGAQQVMLEVKVAEIARTELKVLDVRFNTILTRSSKWDFGGANGGATFPNAVFGNQLDMGEFEPAPLNVADKGLFASFLTENSLFNLAFDVAKDNDLAKILAEPTLTTQTGQEATFLSGGEFPIPVPNGDRGTTIEFKEFGVAVKFLPLVLDAGRINLKINISVSEITERTGLTVIADGASLVFGAPSLSVRSAQTTVELADGQTIGIAGLINENLRETVTKFPGLGDIPGLGALFRSQSFQKGETELLILVTPHLVKPMVPGEIRLPTDKFQEPNDWEFFLGGQLEGRANKDAESTFGHETK